MTHQSQGRRNGEKEHLVMNSHSQLSVEWNCSNRCCLRRNCIEQYAVCNVKVQADEKNEERDFSLKIKPILLELRWESVD